jgi:prepilin-type N-terminal cleavage/methylation domain-containing protein
MKLHPTNTTRKARKAGAFTLIEMIGVLAIIAILAAVLIPKVFNAINDARINNACVSIETIKTATVDHYGKYGKLNSLFGTNDITVVLAGANYCTAFLLPEQLIDKPFSVKIGGGDPSTNAIIQIITGAGSGGGNGYLLDGISNGVANAGAVVEAVIGGVALKDAKDLSDRIDGGALGTVPPADDTLGRVRYAGTEPTKVYIYITHR